MGLLHVDKSGNVAFKELIFYLDFFHFRVTYILRWSFFQTLELEQELIRYIIKCDHLVLLGGMPIKRQKAPPRFKWHKQNLATEYCSLASDKKDLIFNRNKIKAYHEFRTEFRILVLSLKCQVGF